MTNAMEWLKAKAPGFNHLSEDEQNAITDFSFLWTLFESRVLASNVSARAICNAVDNWDQTGTLIATIFDEELAYFRNRYYEDNALPIISVS